MFDLIVNPLVTALVFFYDLFGSNIVVAIAVLTIVIRLALSPLLISQQRNTKAMQEVQPQLNKIREKYKNDREKLAQAQMELFRENKVNPLGGCLPLFIQMPILLALYRTINHALASTPFELIDLSDRLFISGLDSAVPIQNMWAGMDLTLSPTANPLYALAFPALVMATTWLQSRLTIPTPKGDDANNQTAQMTRTMTTVMPLMFGFFSLSFSVGLSIYFVVSNVVGVIQYTLMGRAEWGRLIGREPEEETKAEEKKPAKAEIDEPKDKKAKPAKEDQNGKSKPDKSTPTRPSNRKNKKMKKQVKASGKS